MKTGIGALLFILVISTYSFAEPPGTGATDWINLIEKKPEFTAVAGSWDVAAGSLKTNGQAAARAMLPVRPNGDYDYRVSFTRNSGNASISLFFTLGKTGQAGFEVDAWNRGLAGLQQINGQGIPENGTQTNHRLTNGKRHTMQISVRGNRAKAYFDGEEIASYQGDGSDLQVMNLWQLPNRTALGIGAYQSPTTFHSIELRAVGNNSQFVALQSTTSPTPAATPTPQPTPNNTATINAKGKRVLLVIANQDFFYREYANPKEELERAGIKVDVAAGRRSTCRPHSGSGYRNGDGSVEPDLTIAQAKAEDYDAIMFSGGWGSSAYQYAFEGEYRNNVYNGSRTIKRAVNKLINEFVDQDKYVCALCHGVSILAWSRVDGKSLLDGKTVCCYPRQAPAGTGRQPLSSWDSSTNGAKVLPSRSVGNPNTDIDDVYVDGKVLTGENDPSSSAFGRTLAGLLAKES